ncbi:winged helix DNA-binding domain-containing protein [Mesorhizobium sp. CA14]|uniref:DNA glycosylase AlkZ-like family protein n=1 Tax=Mesorhizobium sp. CA14 TaxID=2876642 RepID=UPI001CCD39B6|nr:crosslink repair DNA glycosylase YcaQ family protein [Mesorhizobium sp. CA14]MBZ9849677.1 winged helix DNA-binding domain-containing protein [Mesorhizobium sp. CA14]
MDAGEWRRIPRSLAGLHAARFKSPVHSLAARVELRSKQAGARELYGAKDMIKIRCMRGTLHVVPLDQAHFFHSATWRQRRGVCERLIRDCGVASHELRAALALISRLLKGRQLTPIEIENEAANQGLTAKPLVRSALKLLWERGDLCYLNRSDRWAFEERRYGTTQECYGTGGLDLVGEEAAEASLVRAYFAAYGPAMVSDAAWWSGLGRSRVERAVSSMDDLIKVDVVGEPGPHLMMIADLEVIKPVSDQFRPTVRLLAYEDNLLKGYMPSRVRFADPVHFPRIFNAIGEARATVMSSGIVIGTWIWNSKTSRPELELFRQLSHDESELLTIEMDRLVYIAAADD